MPQLDIYRAIDEILLILLLLLIIYLLIIYVVIPLLIKRTGITITKKELKGLEEDTLKKDNTIISLGLLDEKNIIKI